MLSSVCKYWPLVAYFEDITLSTTDMTWHERKDTCARQCLNKFQNATQNAKIQLFTQKLLRVSRFLQNILGRSWQLLISVSNYTESTTLCLHSSHHVTMVTEQNLRPAYHVARNIITTRSPATNKPKYKDWHSWGGFTNCFYMWERF